MKKYLTNSFLIWTIILHILVLSMLIVGGVNNWYGKGFGSLVFINVLLYFLMSLKVLANSMYKVSDRWIIVFSALFGIYYYLPNAINQKTEKVSK